MIVASHSTEAIASMPLYEYHCQSCRETFELLRPMRAFHGARYLPFRPPEGRTRPVLGR